MSRWSQFIDFWAGGAYPARVEQPRQEPLDCDPGPVVYVRGRGWVEADEYHASHRSFPAEYEAVIREIGIDAWPEFCRENGITG